MKRKTIILSSLICAGLWGAAPQAAAEQLFGHVGFKSARLNALPRWVDVLDKIQQEQPVYTACERDADACPSRAVEDWRRFVVGMRGQSPLKQLEAVNKYANKWAYITDSKLWRKSDYWASPLEFIAHSGDCEDYSIFKYVTLKQMGFREDQLRMVVVKDTVRNIAHAVLSVQVEGKTYIMDNLFNRVLEDKQMLQYKPYYSVNANARWSYIPTLNNNRNRRFTWR